MPRLPWRSLAPVVVAVFAALGTAVERPLLAQGHGVLPRDVEVGELPSGFAEKIVARGIDGATGMAVAPDGRVFVCEQPGALRVVKDDVLLERPFVELEVDSYWERGLIGVALDPAFEENGHLYLHYTARRPCTHFRVSRFTAEGDRAARGSERILIEGDDQSTLGGTVPAGHQGGGLAFGNDGKLYIVIGEMTTGMPSQRLDTFLGKILRIHPAGAIPKDNPFYATAEGKYRAIWAIGLRNPFAVSIERRTGRMFVNDVGQSRWEEINEIQPGANYGWPWDEGPTDNPAHTSPVHAYVHHERGSISGGTFYEPEHRQFPASYQGKYFFAEYEDHWIKVLDPQQPAEAEAFATGLAGPVAIAVAPDGSLYYLNRNMWIKDKKYRHGTSSLHRVVYAPSGSAPAPRIETEPADRTAATGEAIDFEVSATASSSPIRYQWLRDGKPLPGATASRCTIASVDAADDRTEFRCVVSSSGYTAKSRAATLRVARLRAPSDEARLVVGLELALYRGGFHALPDFDALTPAATGTLTTLQTSGPGGVADSLSAKGLLNVPFGLRVAGFIRVPEDGAYTLELSSNGVSKLFVASREIATTSPPPGGQTDAEAGEGAAPDATAASGSVGLRAGAHSLLLLSIHGSGRPWLNVRISGPTGPPRALRASELFRRDPRQPSRGRSSAREIVTTLNIPADPRRLPRRLSRTGFFRSLNDLTPHRGIVAYDVRLPSWSGGARTRRWMALPGDSTIERSKGGSWRFPPGTVFAQQLEVRAVHASGEATAGSPASASNTAAWRRLETRILRVGEHGLGYGVTYRWRPDGSNAELLETQATEELAILSRSGGEGDAGRDVVQNVVRDVAWTYPRRTECLSCHNANAGFVLGVYTRQLEGAREGTEGQLETWSRMGLFSSDRSPAELTAEPALVSPDDSRAPLEARVRSYIHVNCAHCHRPGGPRGKLDARLDASNSLGTIVGARPETTDFGIPRANIVAPGDPYRSTLYYRLSKLGLGGMPPLGSDQIDDGARSLVRKWIVSLRPEGEETIRRRQKRLAREIEAAADGEGDRLDALLSSTENALALADMAAEDRLPARARARLVERAGTDDDLRVRGLFERFLPRELRVQRIGTDVDASRILRARGDAGRGRRLFTDAPGLRCATCHGAENAERNVGPGLARIAEKYADAGKLLSAIVDPSKEVDPEFQTQLVLTMDGRALNGIVEEKTGERIVLVDAAGERLRLRLEEIRTIIPQPQSLMPDGLLGDLTHQQAADLLAYLLSAGGDRRGE